MTIKRICCAITVAAAALVNPSLSAAEGEEAERIDEVRVVATRLEQTLKDVPAAISVVGQQDIQRGRQLLGLDEALNRVPGVFAQNRYNFAQDLRLAIRGFGARANFGIRGLKIYQDGIPATTADGQSGVDDIDMSSLQRIEVLRGPSAALYGAASGGVVNLITEDGGEVPFVQSGVVVGEDGQRTYRVKTGGQSGALNYLLSLSDLTFDGYRDNARVEATQFNSKFRYDFADRGDLTVVVNAVDSPRADDAGAITAAQVDADPTQAQPRNLSSNAGEAVEQQKLGWVYRREIGEDSLLTVRNYYVWRDFEAFLPIGTHIPFVADDGVVEFDRFFYGGGVQLDFGNALFGRPGRTTVGLDVDVQSDDRQRYLNNAGVRGALSFDQEEEAHNVGLFLRHELELSEAVTIVAGLRYDEVELEVDDAFIANGDQSDTLDFDEVSPMLGVVVDVTDRLAVYANYGTSFETPTFTELANPARNLSVSLGGFDNVEAQTASSFEVGLRGSPVDSVYIDAAVFSMDVDDEITSVANIGNRAFFQNADTERNGVELSLVAEPAEGLRVSLAYAYTDFEFDDFASNPTLDGNALPGLPEQQLFAEVAYDHSSGFYVVGDVLYVDEIYADNANTVENDASTVANLRAGWANEMGRWRVAPFVGINNVFDETYNANVRINGFGGRLFEPGPERHFYGGLTVDYAWQ